MDRVETRGKLTPRSKIALLGATAILASYAGFSLSSRSTGSTNPNQIKGCAPDTNTSKASILHSPYNHLEQTATKDADILYKRTLTVGGEIKVNENNFTNASSTSMDIGYAKILSKTRLGPELGSEFEATMSVFDGSPVIGLGAVACSMGVSTNRIIFETQLPGALESLVAQTNSTFNS